MAGSSKAPRKKKVELKKADDTEERKPACYSMKEEPTEEADRRKVTVETKCPMGIAQMDQAGIDAAERVMRSNSDITSVDIEVKGKDFGGVDWTTRGGWTRRNMHTIPRSPFRNDF